MNEPRLMLVTPRGSGKGLASVAGTPESLQCESGLEPGGGGVDVVGARMEGLRVVRKRGV